MSRPGATPYAGRGRRRGVLRWVFLALLLVPLLEIAVIIAVGRVIGGWPTFLLLLAESLFGAWIVRREGGRAWTALREALRSGAMPSRELADAALVLVGGTLLLTPGLRHRRRRVPRRPAVDPPVDAALARGGGGPPAARALRRLAGRRTRGGAPGGGAAPGGPDVIPGEVVD